MRKWVFLCVTILAFGLTASAQDYPKAEIFGGYSYLRVSAVGTSFNFNGGSASVDFNLNHWFGIVGDFGGYHNSQAATGHATIMSYVFGPKLAYRGNEKITPFAQVLFGGAHVNNPIKAGASKNAFAMTFGGGLDWNATQHFGIRLIQAEYAMTKFKDGKNNRQNNARISAGVTLRW